jgi:hypothetical protein
MMAEKIGGFSSADYTDLCGFFGLDPSLNGSDIHTYQLVPTYIPMSLFEEVIDAVELYQSQYGQISEIFNEAGISHLMSSVRTKLCAYLTLQILGPFLRLFQGGMTNKPEYTMSG